MIDISDSHFEPDGKLDMNVNRIFRKAFESSEPFKRWQFWMYVFMITILFIFMY